MRRVSASSPALTPRLGGLRAPQLTGAAAEASALARTHLEEAAKAAAASGAVAQEAPPAPDADFVDADGDGDELPDAADGGVSAASPPLLDDPDSASGDFTDRARYIPVRLTLGERKRLRLLEAALSVSDYTDKVDIVSYSKSKVQRINKQLLEICAILCGMVVACDFKLGQDLIGDKEFKDNAEFFQMVFEIGRRHKVMNPDKMRTEYGKLVYLLQDSQLPDVQALLEFRIVKPLKTVYTVLADAGCLGMLSDPLLTTAVSEIYPDGRQRQLVARDIRAKEQAREKLAAKYAREGRASEEELLACIYSIADNAAYLRFNRDPVDKCVSVAWRVWCSVAATDALAASLLPRRMISYLQHYFSPREVEDRAFSLAISVGSGGARLSHPHERQYAYVLQSLTLWREVTHDMFRLWYLAEDDLLREGNWYRLADTGQGLNRVQQAPGVSRAIHALLRRCQERLGSWVGSSVVHLGDHNVPNARKSHTTALLFAIPAIILTRIRARITVMFIDKYTQVPRILAPVVLAVEQIDKLAQDPGIGAYINSSFGGTERCVLRDERRGGYALRLC